MPETSQRNESGIKIRTPELLPGESENFVPCCVLVQSGHSLDHHTQQEKPQIERPLSDHTSCSHHPLFLILLMLLLWLCLLAALIRIVLSKKATAQIECEVFVQVAGIKSSTIQILVYEFIVNHTDLCPHCTCACNSSAYCPSLAQARPTGTIALNLRFIYYTAVWTSPQENYCVTIAIIHQFMPLLEIQSSALSCSLKRGVPEEWLLTRFTCHTHLVAPKSTLHHARSPLPVLNEVSVSSSIPLQAAYSAEYWELIDAVPPESRVDNHCIYLRGVNFSGV